MASLMTMLQQLAVVAAAMAVIACYAAWLHDLTQPAAAPRTGSVAPLVCEMGEPA